MLERQARVPELVPIRYGRMLASPFAFYRGAAAVMAADLARDAGHRAAGAALRRRPPLQLRRLRRARPAPRLRLNDFDETLPGPVGVGRQAARRELRDRRRANAASKRRAARARWSTRRRAATARRCASSPRCATSRSGTRGSTSSRRSASALARPRSTAAGARLRRNLAKARAKDSLRALEKLTDEGRRRAADRQRTAADRRRSRSCRRRRRTPTSRRCCGGHRRLPRRRLAARPPAPARRLPLRRRSRARWSGSAASAPAPGSSCCSAATTATRSSCRPRRREASVLEPYAGASAYAQPRPARGRGPAADAGGERHLPRLVPRRPGSTAQSATSTCASSGTARARPTSSGSTPARLERLRAASAADPGPRPRALRRPHRDRRLPRRRRRLRPGDRRVRRGLRRPERARLRGAARRRSTPAASRPRTSTRPLGSAGGAPAVGPQGRAGTGHAQHPDAPEHRGEHRMLERPGRAAGSRSGCRTASATAAAQALTGLYSATCRRPSGRPPTGTNVLATKVSGKTTRKAIPWTASGERAITPISVPEPEHRDREQAAAGAKPATAFERRRRGSASRRSGR